MPLRRHSEAIEEGSFAPGLHLVETTRPLEELIASGGDHRLSLATDKRNSYGCTPFPRPSVLAFGSSTASNISQRAFTQAQAAQAQLWLTTIIMGASAAFDADVERARQRLRDVLGISGAEIVFCPSGTDAQLQALFHAASWLGQPLTTVIAGSDQTGSGTAFTARGHHFSDCTSLGAQVQKDSPVAAISANVSAVSVPFCDAGGDLRTKDEMDGAVYAAVAQAVGRGDKVLLQVMDASKLGWRAPSIACIHHIAAAWPGQVWIVVDACQMRVGRAQLQDYLTRGYLVLLTGSKFFTGPAFSGALLIPQSKATQTTAPRTTSDALGNYTTRHDWPLPWQDLRQALPATCNYGQWLRWEAALAEMEAYFTIPDIFREDFFAALGREIPRIIAASGNLDPVSDARDPADMTLGAEMRHQTIFSFAPCRDGESLPLEQCSGLYRAMGMDLSELLPRNAADNERRIAGRICEIGQPVALGHRPGAALRICVSARQASDCWENSNSAPVAAQSVLAGVRAVVGKLDWLIDNPQFRNGN